MKTFDNMHAIFSVTRRVQPSADTSASRGKVSRQIERAFVTLMSLAINIYLSTDNVGLY